VASTVPAATAAAVPIAVAVKRWRLSCLTTSEPSRVRIVTLPGFVELRGPSQGSTGPLGLGFDFCQPSEVNRRRIDPDFDESAAKDRSLRFTC
jgi:hypothetical protein